MMLYFEKYKHGWKLSVAIDDVSHYVKQNSSLDDEAYLRGTSVYFPNRVIPMLPEILSNELCSLKPNKERLSLVCNLNIGSDGKIEDVSFKKAVIRSHARLTYNEMSKIVIDRDNFLIGGVEYAEFLVHGLIMMQILQNAFMNTTSSIMISKVQGNIVDLLWRQPDSQSRLIELTVEFPILFNLPFGSIITVSYTHLTLPTNREV